MNKEKIKEFFLSDRNICDELKKIDKKKLIINICIIFSFYVIKLFMSSFVKFEFNEKIFNLFWFILIYMIFSIVKHKRFWYTTIYMFFFICSIVQYFHIDIVQKPFGFSQLLYIKEGMTYTNSILSSIDIKIILYLVFGIVNYIVCLKLIKKYLKNDSEFQILKNMILLFIFIPLLVASKHTYVNTFNRLGKSNNKFFAQFSCNEIYQNFGDKESSLKMTGIFEYSIREPWLYIKKLISHDTKEKIKLINNYFEERDFSYEENEYTGIFKDKNVIIIMAESIDSWLIDENTMPTVYNIQQNSLNFINRYAPFYGSGRTLNTEYCLNTGLYIPIDYNIYTAEDNVLKYSLANMFKQSGYYTSSIHFNNGKFYDRIDMHKAYGYDDSYFLADMTKKYYYNDVDIVKNDKFYNLMINNENKFLTFFTTYSAHLPYDETNKLCKDINNEEECIKKLAKLTDDAIKILLEKLEKDNLLNDTVIVFITDHYAYGYDDEEIEKIKGGKDNIHLDKVPLFIWNNNKYAKQIDEYIDTQDILPTLLNLFGIEYENVYIGTDVFNENHNNYVYFSDNSYIGDINDISIEDIQYEQNINEWLIKTNYYTKK